MQVTRVLFDNHVLRDERRARARAQPDELRAADARAARGAIRRRAHSRAEAAAPLWHRRPRAARPLGIAAASRRTSTAAAAKATAAAVMQWTTRGNDFVRCRLDPSCEPMRALPTRTRTRTAPPPTTTTTTTALGRSSAGALADARAGGGGDALLARRSPALQEMGAPATAGGDQRARRSRERPPAWRTGGAGRPAPDALRAMGGRRQLRRTQVTIHLVHGFAASVGVGNSSRSRPARLRTTSQTRARPPTRCGRRCQSTLGFGFSEKPGRTSHSTTRARCVREVMERRIVRTPPLDSIVERLVPGGLRHPWRALQGIACGPQHGGIPDAPMRMARGRSTTSRAPPPPRPTPTRRCPCSASASASSASAASASPTPP